MFRLQLVRLEGEYFLSADKPVIVYKAPNMKADVTPDLPIGFMFSALWKVKDMDWYAYEKEGGKKAFFQGDVFRLQLVRLEGEYFLSADKPVIVYKAPDTKVDAFREPHKGFMFDALWKVKDTDWYAYEKEDGKKAFF